MTKKILLICDDFVNESTKAGSIMIKELADSIDSNPNFSTIVLAPSNKSNFSCRTSYEGTDLILYPTRRLKGTNHYLRFFNELNLSRQIKKCYNFIRDEDIYGIIYYSPSIFFGRSVKYLKNRFNCKSYLILRDLFPQWLVDVGVIKKISIQYIILKQFEKINYKSADRIGVMSASNLQLFSNRLDFSKFEVLHNWKKIDAPQKFKPISKICNLKYLKGKFVFFYGGNIGLSQDIGSLLKLAKSLKNHSKIHFIFIGSGSSVKLLNDYEYNNVTYLEEIGKDDYHHLVKNFDVGIFSLKKSHTSHNFPGKIFTYMSLSKPIIGVVNEGNDLKNLINNNNAGLVCYHSEGFEKLISHCIDLSKNIKLKNTQSKNSFQLISKFSPENTAAQILNYFESIFLPSN